ncbi:MAG TPA: MFS transporter [Chloroflexota bacterium]|nr:MFS transporter [Chloroflexota bacterium]
MFKIGRLAGARGQLTACSTMHVVNDGLFAGTYPLLPLVAAELGLSYAQVGALKTAYSGASSVLQVPAGFLAERMGEQLLLALGTTWVGLGLLLVALTASYLPLLVANVAAGIGGNVQHPVASAVVSRVFDGGRRATAIGTLNFAGDVGKVLAPLVVGIAAATGGWRAGFLALGAIGAVFGIAYAFLIPEPAPSASPHPPTSHPDPSANPAAPPSPLPQSGWGIRAPGTFAALIAIGMLDAAARGTALVFIPFVLQGKGAEAASMSFYFAVLFAAGAAGKFLCGPLGDRFGSAAVIAITELITAAALVGLVGAPLELALLAILPLGFMLNGTSSVLYAAVASLVHASRRARGYGLYYTCSQVSSAASPLLYGLLADWLGLTTAIVTLALATAAIVPLALVVGPRLSDS